MISCETGKVKITGKIDEIKAEATVLMNAMYGTICKEEGEESADKFFDKLTKRAKMSKLGLISDVLGCIGECVGGFKKDKKYIFDKDTYIKDMKSSDGFDDKDLEFASNYDGEEVEVIASSSGLSSSAPGDRPAVDAPRLERFDYLYSCVSPCHVIRQDVSGSAVRIMYERVAQLLSSATNKIIIIIFFMFVSSL